MVKREKIEKLTKEIIFEKYIKKITDLRVRQKIHPSPDLEAN